MRSGWMGVMLAGAALLLAAQAPAQSAPPAPDSAPASPFALPFATGQLMMSFLDAAPFCRAEGHGAFADSARRACERMEPSTAAVANPAARVVGGMVIEVQRDGQAASFPQATPLPLVYEAVADVEVGADGRASACHNVSEDRHGNGSMFGGDGGMCAEMLRDLHPFLADASLTPPQRGRVAMRFFSSERPGATPAH